MARRKVLKSVVRSVADSFTSLMNYRDNDYLMGHLLTAARESGEETLEINLLTSEATPPQLLTKPVSDSVEWYCRNFEDLVARSGSDPGFVRGAGMSVHFDTDTEIRRRDGFIESPYVCQVVVEDDLGKRYEARLTGWWFPEKLESRSMWKRLKQLFK